ncbi:MAG: hypothetical protein V3T31_10470, partial [candidate division Zixibacteria bacterium]
MNRSTRILLIIAALLVMAAVSSKAQVDPGIEDTVRLVSSDAFTNSSAIVPVYFYNDQELSSTEVTLRFSSSDIQLDTVVFEGTRLDGAGFKGFTKLDDTTFTIFGL